MRVNNAIFFYFLRLRLFTLYGDKKRARKGGEER